MTARSLTSIASAVGKLKLAHAELLAALTEQVVSQLKRGGGQGLDAFGVANVAWATLTLTLTLTPTLTLTLILTRACSSWSPTTRACRSPSV